LPKSKISTHKRIFQIQMRNYLYLDRTGFFMKITNDVLDGWEGGVQGFSFKHKNGRLSGRITLNDFAVSSENITTNDEFFHCLTNLLPKIPEAYESTEILRIGFRTISLISLSKHEALKISRGFFIDRLEDLISPTGDLSGIDTTFRFDLEEEKHVNLRLYYGKRTVLLEDGIGSRTEDGLIVDIDYYLKPQQKLDGTKEFMDNLDKSFIVPAVEIDKKIKLKLDRAVS
jgi:uncharacterized protein (TIGR04255 family)